MKIWLLTSETPLYNPGGIARYVDNFARYLAAEGHQILVFGRDADKRDGEIAPGYQYRSVVPRWDQCGQAVESPEPDKHPSYPYNVLDYWGAFSFQMAEAVIEEIKRAGPPDVIESQEYGALPYYLLQRKLTGESCLRTLPVVVNAHSPDFIIREFNEEPRYQFPHYWTGRLEKFCLHAADAVICPSAYLSRQLEELYGNSISVRHIPLPWTDPEKTRSRVGVDPSKVVYFGRLEVRKGVLRLLQSCAPLWQAGREFSLHLIGADTPYYPRNCTVGEWIRKKYARWMEKGRLVVHDAMPHPELMREIQSAAFTVIPSLWENWPNTCIEAMSLGKGWSVPKTGDRRRWSVQTGPAGLSIPGRYRGISKEPFSLPWINQRRSARPWGRRPGNGLPGSAPRKSSSPNGSATFPAWQGRTGGGCSPLSTAASATQRPGKAGMTLRRPPVSSRW